MIMNGDVYRAPRHRHGDPFEGDRKGQCVISSSILPLSDWLRISIHPMDRILSGSD